MIKYEVGQRFPHQRYLRRGELTTSMLNTAFFDVVCVLSNITTEEKKDWRKGNLTICLYENEQVPFICFKFDDWSFDVNININKVNDEHIDHWLNSEANTINLYLIEATTGVLEAMRLISIPKSFSEKIRDICEKQTAKSTSEVDTSIQQTLITVSTDDMIKKAITAYKIK